MLLLENFKELIKGEEDITLGPLRRGIRNKLQKNAFGDEFDIKTGTQIRGFIATLHFWK